MAMPSGATTTQPLLGAAPHVERPRGGLRQGAVGGLGTDAGQQVSPHDAAAHVSADQERQAAEHLLLGRGYPGGRQHVPDAFGQLLVECHTDERRAQGRHGARFPARRVGVADEPERDHP